MDDLIGRLVAHAGVDRAATVTAVGVIAQISLNEGHTDKVRALIRHIPSADAAMPVPSSSLRTPRIGQFQAIITEALTFSREQAGDDAVGNIAGAIPGLGQFV
jgi:hypothetical protein